MKKESKFKKLFSALDKEERLEFLSKYLDEDEKEELVKETKETEETETKAEKEVEKVEETTKETTKEETKQEVQKQVHEEKVDYSKIKEIINGVFDEKFKPYEGLAKEVETIKKDIPKAKDFGVNPTNTSTEDNDFEKSRQNLVKLNNF